MGKIRTRNTSDSSFRNAVSKDENELVGNRDQLKVLVQNNSDEIQREPLLKAMEEGRWDAPSLLDFAHMMRTKIDQLKSEIPDCSSAIEREAVESLLSEGKLDTARLSIESLENSHGVSDPKGY